MPLDSLRQDLRYGVRMLRKHRLSSLVAVVSLAAGIGASSVIFSFANAFLFRPLPAADASELVQVFTSDFDGPSLGGSSYADYRDYRDRTGVFRGLLASMGVQASLSDRNRPELVGGVLVSDDYFDVLGLRPVVGRFFIPGDARAGAPPVVVLSHDAWRRRFGLDPRLVGTSIGLNGHSFTVIGIGPARFSGTSFDREAEFFLPVAAQSALLPGEDILRDRGARAFTVLGRLNTGVTIESATAALAVVASQLLLEDPEAWRDRTGAGRAVTVMPEVEARSARAAPGAFAWIVASVAGAVLVLLGVACVNVATLLVARSASRRREVAVRLAVGASRARLVRQLLVECLLLAGTGGALGLALAQTSAVLFSRFRPDGVPAFNVTLDYRVLLFGLGAACATTLLFGLAPALQATQPDVQSALKNTTLTTRRRRLPGLRDSLVVVQVGLALVLVASAALLLRSHVLSRFEDPGFRREGLVNVAIDTSTLSPDRDRQAAYYRDAVRSVRTVPGVDRVALASLLPMDGSNRSLAIDIDRDGSTESIAPDTNIVGPGYFALMRIRMMQGREFGEADEEGAPAVAIVNDAMARRYWDGAALGQVFRALGASAPVQVQIVGVVADVRHRAFSEPPRPMVFFPVGQRHHPRMTMHVDAAAQPAAIGAAVLGVLRDLGPAAALGAPRTMADHMAFVTMPQRLGGWTAAAVGFVELSLAMMALYSVIAFAVAQRTREVAVRMALGAPAGSVARLIMRDGARLLTAGLVLGVLMTLASSGLLAEFLIGIGPSDPLTLGAAAAIVGAVALGASYVPARRAVRIEPGTVLKGE